MKRNLFTIVMYGCFAASLLFIASATVRADGVGHSQFRRLVDPSERSAVGTLVLTIKGSQQTVDVSLNGLTGPSLASYFALNATPPFQPQNFTNYFLGDIS